LSATEGKGDYFIGLFFGASLPTGSSPNTAGHTILSPTLAVGKGFGPRDLQSTIGGSLAASGSNMLGRSIVFNTALDYRIKGKLWSMIEQNSTFWYGGLLDGKRQTFITPGVVLGAFPIEKWLHFSVGVGYQIAATSFANTPIGGFFHCAFHSEVNGYVYKWEIDGSASETGLIG
jgi:hypothetical protein